MVILFWVYVILVSLSALLGFAVFFASVWESFQLTTRKVKEKRK